jgi:hypothetical protein
LVDFNASDAQLSTCLFTKSSMGWLWHRRLSHVGIKQLNRLIKHDLVRGIKDVVFEKDKLYSSCQASKQVRNTHYKISTLLPLDAICITTNCVVIGVCFATVVQKCGNRGTMLPQK